MTGKVLIVDDLATNRIILKVKMAAAFHKTLQAADGRSALDIARREVPHLILLDMVLPDLNGIEVCAALRADPVTRDIPVVMITAHDEPRLRLAALRAGADDFMTKPVNEHVLRARVRSLLRASDTESELKLRAATTRALGLQDALPLSPDSAHPGVAVVGDDVTRVVAWRRALNPHLPGTPVTLTPEHALSGAEGAHDTYLIVASTQDVGAAMTLLSDLRARAHSRHAALIVALTDPSGTASGTGALTGWAATALDLGANDIIYGAQDATEVALRLTLHAGRKRRADLLRAQMHHGLELAVTDPLTGLYNRRYALPHLDRIARQAGQLGEPFAVLVMDIDRFKSVNDTYGHAIGDSVLAGAAARLRDVLRPSDLLARIGGEEFLIVLNGIGAADAQAAAHRLCRAIDGAPIAGVAITVSVGVALGDGRLEGTQVFERADHALRLAKDGGRNQVTALDCAA